MKFAKLNLLMPFAVALGLMGGDQDAQALDIFSDANDGFIEVRGTENGAIFPLDSPTWPQVHPDTFGNFRARVGEWFGPGNVATVLPFQLPDFGMVTDPFATADLGVMVFTVGDGPTTTDVDLYGLSRIDANPAIDVADYYAGSAFDPSATLIQESFLTPSSSAGFVGAPNNNTDATGDTNLLNFLNAAYAGGANAGNYVFLRLSYGGDNYVSVNDGYEITVREAGLQGEWPVLTVTTNQLPGDVNDDSTIDLVDFGFIRDNWLETNATFGMTLARADGDLNFDGMVDIIDFREWKDAFLAGGGAEAVVEAAFATLGVPEPTSFAGVVLGLMSLCGFRRRLARA